jgi:hypothetical protein
MYDNTTVTKTALSKRADKVGTIFAVIGWFILTIGGLATVITLLAGLFTDDALVMSLVAAVGIAAYTAVMWAWVSLATIIAQYIASKS